MLTCLDRPASEAARASRGPRVLMGSAYGTVLGCRAVRLVPGLRVWGGGVERPLGLARLEDHHRDLAVGLDLRGHDRIVLKVEEPARVDRRRR
jgi:hypothetical protein